MFTWSHLGLQKFWNEVLTQLCNNPTCIIFNDSWLKKTKEIWGQTTWHCYFSAVFICSKEIHSDCLVSFTLAITFWFIWFCVYRNCLFKTGKSSLPPSPMKKITLKQLKALTWHPAVLLELTLSEVWCQLKLVGGGGSVHLSWAWNFWSHLWHVFSEAYNFLMWKKLGCHPRA